MPLFELINSQLHHIDLAPSVMTLIVQQNHIRIQPVCVIGLLLSTWQFIKLANGGHHWKDVCIDTFLLL